MFNREPAHGLVRRSSQKSNGRSNSSLDQRIVHPTSDSFVVRILDEYTGKKEERIASIEARKQLPTLEATGPDRSDRFLEASKRYR